MMRPKNHCVKTLTQKVVCGLGSGELRSRRAVQPRLDFASFSGFEVDQMLPFAFGPKRRATLLITGDKAGRWDQGQAGRTKHPVDEDLVAKHNGRKLVLSSEV